MSAEVFLFCRHTKAYSILYIGVLRQIHQRRDSHEEIPFLSTGDAPDFVMRRPPARLPLTIRLRSNMKRRTKKASCLLFPILYGQELQAMSP